MNTKMIAWLCQLPCGTWVDPFEVACIFVRHATVSLNINAVLVELKAADRDNSRRTFVIDCTSLDEATRMRDQIASEVNMLRGCAP